jgi:hypothetical protein
VIYGHDGQDDITARQVAYGGAGGDMLRAPVVYGGLGDDKIERADVVHYRLGDGTDTLVAGVGNTDNLSGGAGDDKYVLSASGGVVSINDSAEELNTLTFSDDVTYDSLGFQVDGSLKIRTAKGGDVRISGWEAGHSIKLFKFADGTTVSDTDIAALERTNSQIDREYR